MRVAQRLGRGGWLGTGHRHDAPVNSRVAGSVPGYLVEIRVLGAALALAVAGIGWVVIDVVAHDAQIRNAIQNPVWLVALVPVGVAGASFAPRVLRSGRLVSPCLGAVAGVSAGLLFLLIAVFSAFVSSLIRGGATAAQGMVPVAWLVFALAYFVVIGGLVPALPGAAWALLLRGLHRFLLGSRFDLGHADAPVTRHGPRFRWVALAAVVVATASAGWADAAARTPAGTRCIGLDGEAPKAGAWSPDGTLLAIASTADPNSPGRVRVIRWPSQQLVAEWTGVWVDQTVAVAPDGTAYWSTSILGTGSTFGQFDAGTVEASPSGAPKWLSTVPADDPVLWSLSWTRNGLLGATANDKRALRIPLDGPDRGQALPIPGASGPVEFLWSSPDGTWLVTSSAELNGGLEIRGPGGVRTLTDVQDVRAVSMTADHRSVVATPWLAPTYTVDVQTGARRQLIGGSQLWSTVSSRGDVAWTDDEQGYPGVVCVAKLI